MFIKILSAIFETSGIGVRKSPFTDSEFQRGQNQRYQRKFWYFFRLWELRDYREYSKKSPQIRPEKDEFESFGMLWHYSMSERQRYQFGITRPFLPFFSVCEAEKPCNTNAFWITPKPFPLTPTLLQAFYHPYFWAFSCIFHITIIWKYPPKKWSINFNSTILVRRKTVCIGLSNSRIFHQNNAGGLCR